jgi:FtsH-binding integral membrane protein
MDYSNRTYLVSAAPADVRASFYRKTYGTAALAFAAWAVLLGGLFESGAAVPIIKLMFAAKFSWLLVLGVFWVATHFGQRFAFGETRATQYLGLGIHIAAYAVLFVPLIGVVLVQSGGNPDDAFAEILLPAGVSTAALFAALTATVFMTKTDFSFLRTAVIIGSFLALGAIVLFTLFGVTVGVWFAIAMTLLMSAAILWQTHQLKNSCDTSQHIGAATIIFAAFMTLLWYVIQIFLTRRD